jgi:hypothetical protein
MSGLGRALGSRLYFKLRLRVYSPASSLPPLHAARFVSSFTSIHLSARRTSYWLRSNLFSARTMYTDGPTTPNDPLSMAS